MLSNIQKRFALFLIGCIGVRTLFVIMAKYASKQQLFYMGSLALLPAIGFILIYFSGLRKTGAEVFGDTIWWNDLRIIHAMLYILFAIYAFQNKWFAWMPLGVDVLLGLTAFLLYHYRAGNFKELLNSNNL